ncbi:hypothetical protein ES705_46152 [subsurface metagenome]
MKITKAIEILTDLKDAGIDAGHYDAEDAIQLSIEALKRIKQSRESLPTVTLPLLPGETKD